MRTRLRLALLLLTAMLSLPCAVCFAHPMGNFSVNHYTKISVDADGVQLRYFIDLAEIPTYQELQQANITPADTAALAGFLATRATELAAGLHLRIDNIALPLVLVSKAVLFPPGAGGLPTMKLGFVYRVKYPAGASHAASSLSFEDENYPGHAGWKEIIVTGAPKSILTSSAPATDRSAELSNYPTDMLNSPPQDLTASVRFTLPPLEAGAAAASSAKLPGKLPALVPAAVAPRHAPAAATGRPIATKPLVPQARAPRPMPPAAPLHLQANKQQTARSAFTEIITTHQLSFWFLFTAAFLSMGLGALHALEPGHGKTIVAAYLVGSRGTARHAMLLGLIVTVSHTASVFALGAVTLYASRYILPEQLYPWLNALSGLTIAALGAYLLFLRWSGLSVEHSHVPGDVHTDWFSSLRQQTSHPAPPPPPQAPVSLGQLFTLGITGGIIPCPAALVVLLSALSLHRAGLGFFLIVAFSIGLAAVLIAFGLLMVYARRFMGGLLREGPLTQRWLPALSAVFMMTLGIAFAWRGFAATGISWHRLPHAGAGSVAFVAGLGLLLGIRHSTDADHVVAISTIVTKQGSVRGAAVIGSLWGLGHTLTIFAVGCLIILFGVTIPPRLGLSMEFAVALMLVLLGVLNLTGRTQRIANYLTPLSALSAVPAAAEDWRPRSLPLFAQYGKYQCLRPLCIGLVHGLAGSAAVALLVMSTIRNPVWAVGYLVIFGFGTMLGMMCMTAAMSVPLLYAGSRMPRISHMMTVASGIVSVCFGSFLIYQLGYLGGLFTSHPHWTPQ